jgi:sirohydrochlorin cobaltochelatase
MLKIRVFVVVAMALGLVSSGSAAVQSRGILLLAHGGSAEWNAHVTRLATDVDRTLPTEVAFGMATRANIQSAVDRLRARGATEITAVPLFVSSWSSVITSTEYLLGQRADAPPELALYARMNHSASASSGGHDAASHGASAEHGSHPAADPKAPIDSPVPIRMTPALNDHPLVADILTSRARSISRNAAEEAVVIVAHGPVGDDENRRWLSDMASLATRVGQAERFASIDYVTLRDDAPKPIRDRATAELRDLVTKHLGQGRRVLIVPLLVSFGGIEKGLRERLEGLTYSMPSAGLVPDDRLVTWVLAMANER